MADINVGAKVTKDNMAKVAAAIELLVSTRVMVGIPAENASRPEDPNKPGKTPPNNAEIGYINEFGDPALHIPPRPFLVPGMENAQEVAIEKLKRVAKRAVTGNVEGVDKGLHDVGRYCSNSVKKKITDGPFTPLADYTVWMRANRAKAKRKGAKIELARREAGEAASTEFTKPLIDFGILRRSITYALHKITVRLPR